MLGDSNPGPHGDSDRGNSPGHGSGGIPGSRGAEVGAQPDRVLRPRLERLDLNLDPGAALARTAARAGRALLDSAFDGTVDGGSDGARGLGPSGARGTQDFSLLAFDPIERWPAAHAGSWLDWKRAWRLELDSPAAVALAAAPFRGGFVGALAYDLGVEGEALDLPLDPWGWPPMTGAIYGDALVWDHVEGALWLCLDTTPRADRPKWDVRRERLLDDLHSAPVSGSIESAELARRVSTADHVGRIERGREAIAAGEIYQVNLAHPFEAQLRGHPEALYAALRRANPAPYMGYLEFEPGARGERRALLSASPELLFAQRGQNLWTEPIKGTARRLESALEDELQRKRLLDSGKDLAELSMIVDLARNDLSLLCQPGSVGVDCLPELKSFATVHHLMATVRGRLQEGRDAGDALAALFPAASITGAPKLAAMEHIARLESCGRGYFTGSLGVWDLEDRACFSVLIRSAQWRGSQTSDGSWAGELRAWFGGGITWGSKALAEDQETLDKAEGWVRALTSNPAELHSGEEQRG